MDRAETLYYSLKAAREESEVRHDPQRDKNRLTHLYSTKLIQVCRPFLICVGAASSPASRLWGCRCASAQLLPMAHRTLALLRSGGCVCVCVGGMTWFAPGFVPRPQLANNCHHMAPDAIRILLRQLQDECKENLAAVA